MSDDELIAAASYAGFSVTHRQLERWRNQGLMPPLATRGKGRGRGQDRFYQLDPTDQLLKLLHLRSRKVPISECAIRLWLAGSEIDLQAVRRHLPRALKGVHRFRKLLQRASFAIDFAEYLQRTPRARAFWFRGVQWGERQYDKAVNFAQGMASSGAPSLEVRDDFREVYRRTYSYTEDEQNLIRSLGAEPNELFDRVPQVFPRVVEWLASASDDDLTKISRIQNLLLAVCDSCRRLAELFPNVISAFIGRVENFEDLRSSWGVFAAAELIVLSQEEQSDIERVLDERLQELEVALSAARGAAANRADEGSLRAALTE